jgi:hypothetical protein
MLKIPARKATLKTIDYLGRSLQVLMPDDCKNELFVTFSGLETELLFPQKNASRDVKAILGQESRFLKFTLPGNNAVINAIPLEDFADLCLELAIKGNPIAKQWVKANNKIGLKVTGLALFGQDIKAKDVLEIAEKAYQYTGRLSELNGLNGVERERVLCELTMDDWVSEMYGGMEYTDA